MKMTTDLGTVAVILTYKIKPDVSFWDALKMRLMGRRPAAILLWQMIKTIKDAS